MKNFKLEHFGSNAQGVKITGDKKNQEPEHFIIKLPFGEVEISRTTDGNYWVHVAKKKDEITNVHSGQMKKFRLDSMSDDGIYIPEINGEHLAVLLTQ
jgi:superfamily I DNA and/or RNA helicase